MQPVETEDPNSVAARVFREKRIIVYDPSDPLAENPGSQDSRPYRTQAFLSIPICYGPGGRCVGIIKPHRSVAGRQLQSLRCQAGFGGGQSDWRGYRERPPGPSVISGASGCSGSWNWPTISSSNCSLPPACFRAMPRVAAICRPLDSVGGDFYTFTRLGNGRIGVMLGDVSSHGFSAALVMALVMSAAGIHAGGDSTPDEVLASMLESLGEELASTEMFLSVFYGVLDPRKGRLIYANAGHPHAFRVPRTGDPERLPTTAPPLGLSTAASIQRHR